ncbi:GAP1-N2 domain-containing protein [Neobacillus cucumis]|uniref:Uncharacterized protein n=1 Tax=Neobacillus cucumis TaxID=1740721 RepID=A0A2N5HFK9_9BACI|nr:hypothetical protein [Neobacillus cucumis]PLS04310.1 hypothetical protein CVD27_11725 [Neobacillus cucumis]
MTEKIHQHMYTRERKGIFQDSAGYDTIAMSEGLEPFFVKKYLHPFCLYHGPKKLREQGNRDSSCYPPAVTIFQPETGELVIGQAVFVPADFTGARSTYFMHSFVIPSDQKDHWVQQPEMLFQLKESFQTSYDISQGPVLPELELVSYKKADILEDIVLNRLGIKNADLQQLLYAVMTSISGKKKVFITLNVPLQEYSRYALMLLELLFLYLPYAFRNMLGAITFTSEPETRNYIHVTFFEPGTLNISDPSIKKQFIFDFAGGFISSVSLPLEQKEFFDFAFEDLTRMDDFFKFSEMALAGLPVEEKLSLESYNQLTDLFLTLANDDRDLFLKDKVAFLDKLIKFLKHREEDKSPLVELFLRVLENGQLAVDLNLRMKNLKLEDLKCFRDNISDELVLKIKNETARDYFLVLKALSKLINSSGESASCYLKLLTSNGRHQLNGMLQRILSEKSISAPFRLLFIAFETSNDEVDFPKLLNFIINHYNEMTMCSFIKESANLAAVDLLFRSSLKSYLIHHPRSIWKNKTWRKELQSVNDSLFKLFVKEIEKETSNPLVRLLKGMS